MGKLGMLTENRIRSYFVCRRIKEEMQKEKKLFNFANNLLMAISYFGKDVDQKPK